MEIKIRVVCRDLPGRRFDENAGGERVSREQIGLGLQRGEAIEDVVPADSKLAVFDLVFTVRQQPNGRPNFLGPYAKGSAAERFFYLVWAAPAADGSMAMFRRAKVPLSHLRWEDVEAAAQAGRPLEVELRMTDAKGAPKSGSFAVGEAHWSI